MELWTHLGVEKGNYFVSQLNYVRCQRYLLAPFLFPLKSPLVSLRRTPHTITGEFL